jgi:CDGSH-type Zn-finger protein/truncated hemoglobin YjbI
MTADREHHAATAPDHQATTEPKHQATATAPGAASTRAGQGKLARLLATRGGLAAPEAPFVIEHREALIYMLCEAAELEHGIMCQYLFAAFSLKESGDEGLTAGEVDAVKRWQRQILNVAAGEMLHLALVHNLLSAIGAAPHLSRPNLPAPAGHYPAGVQLALLPFGEQALRHFMFLERPEGMDLQDAEGLAAMQTATPSVDPRDIVPAAQDFATVGHLYRSIEAGFRHLTDKYGEDWLFTGPPGAQATPAHFGWPNLLPVTGLDGACAAVEEIVEQGEGPRGHWRNAHFGQFVAILDEYQRMQAVNPGFEPTRPVMAANVRPHDRAGAVPMITDPLTARVTDLFNVGYEILLTLFERFFAHTTETDAQMKVLADASVALMVQVIKPLGSLITTLPAGPGYPARTAGPSFELFYESDYLMPHQHAAWALLAERLDEAAWLCGELCAGRGTAIAAQLEPVLDAIRQIAASLAAHLPGGRPQAALATVGPRLLPADINALATACTRILDGIPAGASPGQADRAARASRAAGELLSAVGGLPGPGGRSGAGDPDAAAAAGRLREPVLAATRLRASLGLTCPPELTEAVAALQDVLLRVAPPQQEPAWRADLWQAQSSLTPSIQATHNGPYLVTNVPTVVNHLGITTLAAPQRALCRCGASAVKPACDGTCHANGFSDAKDPARVADQRDTYHGQQVTVYDNRGICQHSGFCTDRLPAVFRTNNDPFVAPSGGRMDEIVRAVRDCPSGALSYALGGAEARADVDWDRQRSPAIEITADGPYRVTGRIPLAGADGQPVAHADGASAEHYTLCRCGRSRNKPFCSGMHWYVGFTDPPARPSPTLFEHSGGFGPLTRTARLLYEKHIPADPLLATVFADMPADQPQALAAWLAAALGGPPLPGPEQAGRPGDAGHNRARHHRAGRDRTTRQAEPAAGLPHSLLSPAGQPLTEEQRARWVSLASRAADEAGLPADPGFRSAFASCLEWLSRVATQPAAAGASAEVPAWDWGPGGAPGPAEQDAGEDAAPPVTPPSPGEPVSFDTHIKPLFRDRDRQSMSFAFDLWSADDVRAHAQGILQRLQDGSMPCDGAWPAEQVAVFERWTETGTQP